MLALLLLQGVPGPFTGNSACLLALGSTVCDEVDCYADGQGLSYIRSRCAVRRGPFCLFLRTGGGACPESTLRVAAVGGCGGDLCGEPVVDGQQKIAKLGSSSREQQQGPLKGPGALLGSLPGTVVHRDGHLFDDGSFATGRDGACRGQRLSV